MLVNTSMLTNENLFVKCSLKILLLCVILIPTTRGRRNSVKHIKQQNNWLWAYILNNWGWETEYWWWW